MADARAFDWVCEEVEKKSSLSRLEARGTVRLALKKAGLDAATDAAILRCAAAGLLRSATLVAGGPTDADFANAAREVGLDLGWHVNLTEGRALAGPAASLTDEPRAGGPWPCQCA